MAQRRKTNRRMPRISQAELMREQNSALQWLKDKASAIKDFSRKFKKSNKRKTFEPGMMLMFGYDPKWKKILPFYDKYPLCIIISPAPKGFMGLNLHYLPPELRSLRLIEQNLREQDFQSPTSH